MGQGERSRWWSPGTAIGAYLHLGLGEPHRSIDPACRHSGRSCGSGGETRTPNKRINSPFPHDLLSRRFAENPT